MKNRESIQSELKESGVNLPICLMPEMQLPEGYFEQLPDSILQRIKQADFLDSLPGQTPFEVPQGYFDHFNASLSELIHPEKLLDSIPKVVPYAVPEQYFADLPVQISARLNGPKKAGSVLTFSRSLFARLALAATLLLFMGISLKVFIVPSQTIFATGSAEDKLAGISDEEINHYLIYHQAEIENNLAYDDVEKSDLDLKNFEIEILDHTLNSISDEDLLNYTF